MQISKNGMKVNRVPFCMCLHLKYCMRCMVTVEQKAVVLTFVCQYCLVLCSAGGEGDAFYTNNLPWP